MDNQPRVLPGDSAWSDHSYSAVISARLLVKMAEELGPAAPAAARAEVETLKAEVKHLATYMQQHM
jgi:hypothetical protein